MSRPNPHVPSRVVTAIVFWDFDGTVYRAPAGCRRYGEEIALSLPPEDRPEYLERLDRYLSGRGGVDAADGWEAAVNLVAAYPLGERDDGRSLPDDGVPRRRTRVPAGGERSWHEEFRKGREYLESGECPMEVPAGLSEAISQMRVLSRHILVTNTPSFGVFGLLARLGLAECFDEVVCEAAKPSLLPARLSAAAAIYGLPTSAVLSVGDNFGNDIAPALASGAAGAYVNPYRAGPQGSVNFEATTLEELLPAVQAWISASGNSDGTWTRGPTTEAAGTGTDASRARAQLSALGEN